MSAKIGREDRIAGGEEETRQTCGLLSRCRDSVESNYCAAIRSPRLEKPATQPDAIIAADLNRGASHVGDSRANRRHRHSRWMQCRLTRGYSHCKYQRTHQRRACECASNRKCEAVNPSHA